MSTTPHSQKKRWLFLNVIAGGTMGILSVIASVSFGVVIFSGDLAAGLPFAIGISLFSTAILSAIVSCFGAYASAVATISDIAIPVLSLVARQIVELMPNAPFADKLATVAAAIIFNSVMGGTVLLLLGKFKLGGLIRFIPYPVVGGFIAATGVLLIQGALQSLNGVDYSHFSLSMLLLPNVLLQWLPAVLFALAMFFLPKVISHYLLLPGILAAAISLFYLTLFLTHNFTGSIITQQVVLGTVPSGPLFQFHSVATITRANWGIILQQVPTLAALWLIESIALLLNANGIELLAKRDFDLDRELKIAGAASIASGLGGGLNGFPSIGETTLARYLGGSGRSIGWMIALVCLIMLLGGASILSYAPKFILVGIPLLMGIDALYDWIYIAWFKFSRSDYCIILLIVLVTAMVGYLPGISVGLLAAIVLFVINYSRLAVTKRISSGAYYHSNVLRTTEELELLEAEGEQIYILELQGLIFFGTANTLFNQIRQRLEKPCLAPVQTIILDFRLVSGLDASAVLSFSKLKQLVDQQQVHLLFTNLSTSAAQCLQQGGCLDLADPMCQVFVDLDRALEWCEARILQTYRSLPQPQFESAEAAFVAYLKTEFSDAAQVDRLMTYLKKQSFQTGDYLFRQHDPFDGLYFVGSGQVSVVLELTGNRTKRIRTYTVGNTIGEMGLYRQTVRMASVIADQPSTVYFLSSEAFAQIEMAEPLLAANIHRFVVNLLAERLEHREQELKHLLQA